MFIALAILAGLSLLLALWQWVAGKGFDFHRRFGENLFRPALTVLKPLKGLDEKTLDCLRSWLEQDCHNTTQILFGVASDQDPVCPVVRALLAELGHADAQLVICGESLGFNAKVSTLVQLMRHAKHDIIVVSDADVRVPRDFLSNLVAPLADGEVGLVNSFYRLANPSTTAMRWEAVAINADFWSQVLQGQTIAPLDFALGAVMATRREQLEKIGGFEGLVDYLADDFQLGNRIVRLAKKKITICPVVVDCLDAPMNWRQAWAHQVRWARTIRVCKPVPYALSLLSNATVWPLLLLVVERGKWPLLAFFVCLAARITMAQQLQARLGRVGGEVKYWWLAPVKDLLQVALWLAAFSGNHIAWRGQRLRLQRDGKLVK